MAGIWTSRLRFGPQGWDLGLQARILAFRLGFGPRGWDLGLKTGIWASRLEFGLRDWDLRGGTEKEEEKEKKKEKIPHMCESIGHRPLRGRCPKRKKEGEGKKSGVIMIQFRLNHAWASLDFTS